MSMEGFLEDHSLAYNGLGMKGKNNPNYPQPPDPNQIANAQMRINRDAARMSLINQEGPFGSLNYTEGPNGQFTARQSLDPSETGAVFGARAGANQKLGDFLSRYKGTGSDFSADRDRIEDTLYQRNTSRLDPQYQDREKQLSSRLAAQGITQGSRAYQTALDDFNRERRGAYDEARQSAILGGGAEQSRLFDMSARQRGQEFGEIGGLFDLGRIARFTPQGQGNAGIGAPDFMGASQQQYQGQLGAFNHQQQQSAANRQAMASGASALLSLFCSKEFKNDHGEAPSVLDMLATLPIRKWEYKEHIGPYAEDWAARFGGDGKTINVIDALGIVLKAVQELTLEVRARA